MRIRIHNIGGKCMPQHVHRIITPLTALPPEHTLRFLPVLVSSSSHRHFNNFGNFQRRLVVALLATSYPSFFIISHPAKAPRRTLHFVRYLLSSVLYPLPHKFVLICILLPAFDVVIKKCILLDIIRSHT